MASYVRITVLVWADILALYAMWVMMTYLTNVWKLNFTHAASIINIWGGLAFIMQIGFAFLVDTFMGNYAMLLVSSIAYSIGLGFLAMSTPPVLSKSTGNCSAYKPECIGHTQKILYYTALALIAVGISGHAVSFDAFFKKQTNGQTKEDGRKVPWQCAGLFIVVIVSIIGGIALPYIKPWSIRFGIPSICTVVATLLFVSGSCSYEHDKPQGSPLTTVFRVFVFRCIDKAAIKSDREVEETKIGILMVPICMTFIIFGVVISIGKTYFIEQANHMNRKVGHLTVPPPLFLMFYDFSKEQLKKIEYFFGGSGSKRYGPPTGIAIAMVFSILCCITAAKVETQRHDVIRSHGLLDKPDEKIPMSIFWLLPQFVLLGAVDGISESSIKKFFKDQAPPSMTTYLKFFTQGLFGLGIMASVLFAYIVGKVSEKGGKQNWFQDTLNRSRLDKYYWTLAVSSSVFLVLYILVALCYPYRESAPKDEEAQRNEHSAAQPPYEDNPPCSCCCG
ncbi:protein NRT1/ PTR FAMILY 5.5-like [Cornus florida]|uniref:protein NRT1/ PTR FAMILY 5.5-like n=1 Tax=Cornus florida TaxID=4283 RepID=UPI0028985C8C|nr:protein NRT1/ PTR FAMILY 5.5-like [Cornus florida]